MPAENIAQKIWKKAPALRSPRGGFRATLFHTGTLWRLNELRSLAGLTRISSVSGGSITGGMVALMWDKLKKGNLHQDTVKEVVEPLESLCRPLAPKRRQEQPSCRFSALSSQ